MDLEEIDTPNHTGSVKSFVAASIKDKVEEEKCVVAQYRTTVNQKNAFVQHLTTCSKNKIPIEWVIDIADESNGWFFGTAFHYDDSTQMLHVMVPDKENPTFDGHVLLDHRTVHLIECIDGKTDALFNKITRDSVMKVKWDVEWFEESEDGTGENSGYAADTTGSWISSSARYYIRTANQLLVEDRDAGQESKGFVIITADLNLKLLRCHKGKGADDFYRLINENIVQSSTEAGEAARANSTPSGSPAPAGKATSRNSGSKGNSYIDQNGEGSKTKSNSSGGSTGPTSPLAGAALTPAGKLADMSIGLRECVVDILDDRDRIKTENNTLAEMFRAFTIDGDLDEGLKLLDHYETVRSKGDRLSAAKDDQTVLTETDREEERIEAIAEDAIYLAEKLERNLGKIVRAGGDISNNAQQEIENLRRSLKKARMDLEDREEELAHLKNSLGRP